MLKAQKTDDRMDCVTKEYEKYERQIVNQQLELEKIHREVKSKNLIINGLPEEDVPWHLTDQRGSQSVIWSDDEKALYMFQRIGIDVAYKDVVNVQRIGRQKQSNRPRPLIITMNTIVMKNNILYQSYNLKRIERFKNIFINHDLPPMTRRENQRLRDHMKLLRGERPGSNVILKKGILLVDGREVDKFDVRNQIFRNRF